MADFNCRLKVKWADENEEDTLSCMDGYYKWQSHKDTN